MRRLPPINHLLAFHQCAEHLSFKEAAEALAVTPAAISQRVRQLEEQVGLPLFDRQHRKVVLTPAGMQLHESTKTAFDVIELGLRKISEDPNPDRLNLSVLPSFTQHWLIPRLSDFQVNHPDLQVALMPRNALVDFAKDDVDLCIRFGLGDYPGLESKLLMRDHLYAVCHPSYLEIHPYCCEETIQDMDLLEDARPDMSWVKWLEQTGGKPSKNPSLIYAGAHMVLNGALAGQGVALVRHSLACPHIQQGNLIRIGTQSVCSSYSYYLVAPEHYFQRPKVKQFAEWVSQQSDLFWQNSQQMLS